MWRGAHIPQSRNLSPLLLVTGELNVKKVYTFLKSGMQRQGVHSCLLWRAFFMVLWILQLLEHHSEDWHVVNMCAARKVDTSEEKEVHATLLPCICITFKEWMFLCLLPVCRFAVCLWKSNNSVLFIVHRLPSWLRCLNYFYISFYISNHTIRTYLLFSIVIYSFPCYLLSWLPWEC